MAILAGLARGERGERPDRQAEIETNAVDVAGADACAGQNEHALRPPHYAVRGSGEPIEIPCSQMPATGRVTASPDPPSRRRDFGQWGLCSAHLRLVFLLDQACAAICSAPVHR